MPAIRSAARAKAAPAISNPCGRRQCCDLAPLVSNCLSTRATVTDPNGDPVSRRVSRMSAFRQTFQPPLLPLLAGRRLIRLSILAVRHRAGEDTRSVRQALKGTRGGGREGRRRHCAFSGRGSLKVGVRARTAESFRGVSEIYPTYQPWARTHNATAHTVIRAAPRSGRQLRSRQRAASVSSPLHPTAGSLRSRQRPR